MKSKPMEDFEMAEHRAKITISRKIKKLHPVVKSIANNLARPLLVAVCSYKVNLS